jgi:hypothetical protein
MVFKQARGTANAAQTGARHRKLNLFSRAGKKAVVPSVTLIRVGSTANIRTVYDAIIRKKFHSRHL